MTARPGSTTSTSPTARNDEAPFERGKGEAEGDDEYRNGEGDAPNGREILITREFDAPKHLVYEAYTAPGHVRRWGAGRRGEMTVAEIDLRVGGAWRYALVAGGGFEVAFHGTYREIVPNERSSRSS
jgi:Activator of Hsp90 ATPase homolog 1-like protein